MTIDVDQRPQLPSTIMSENAPDEGMKKTETIAPSTHEEHISLGETVVFGGRNAPAKGFVVPFVIRSSHDINSIGFSGQNTISWPVPFNQSDLVVNGLGPIRLEIASPKSDEYTLRVTGEDQFDEQTASDLASSLESHLTFLLNRKNLNPHYGTFFVQLDLQEFHFLRRGGGPDISDSLAIRSEGHYQPEGNDWSRVERSPLLEYYAEGARASEPKSKYFQWFLIIELLEGSERYQERMGWTPLFSEAEQKLLGAVAEFFGNERKRNIIRDLFIRTAQARPEKLAVFLNHLGINEYAFGGQTHQVAPENLKPLISQRNKLFHAGRGFDEGLLWQQLFPLVTAIANAEHARPLVLK